MLVQAATPSADQLKLLQQLSPEQLKLLQQMSPEQQSALLRSYKGGQGTKKDAEPPEEPVLVVPKRRDAATLHRDSRTAATTGEAPAEIDEASELTEQEKTKQDKRRSANDALQPFGYDLFAGTPTTFAPATDIPVPADYVIGPGDVVQVQLFGKENIEHSLSVSREGQLNFPGVGEIPVAGLSFKELKRDLQQRVARQYIGVQAAVSMGPLRSIRVFVLGDVNQPGSYTVSSLSTLTNALFVSGGVRPIGSLRKIQLKRAGRVVTTMDLYDLLLRGDTSADTRLQPGDVIFVPSVGATVSVAGEVKRPAIYELRDERTVAEVLSLAGGLLPTAYPEGGQLERINRQRERTLVDVNLSDKAGLAAKVQDGDLIRAHSILDRMENVVLLSGHVQRPGAYQWRDGIRVSDLIPNVTDLLPQADLNYLLIRRETLPTRRLEVLAVDLAEALTARGSAADLPLKPRDQVTVFGLNDERSEAIRVTVTELRGQAVLGHSEPIVSVAGSVRYPGDYPLIPEMRLTDLMRAAVNVFPDTDLDYVVIERQLEHGKGVAVLSANLRAAFAQPRGAADPILAPRDKIFVFNGKLGRTDMLAPTLDRLRRQANHGQPTRIVRMNGQVRFPGEYPLEDGMRVSDLLRAAGGLQESAYAHEAEITRLDVGDGRQRRITHVTIPLARIAEDSEGDIALQAYDIVTVKELPQWHEQDEVMITGEVRFPGAYPINRGETLHDLIRRAGGFTEQAYVDGAVFTREELRVREQESFDRMAEKLEADLAAQSIERLQTDPDKMQAFTMARELVKQIRETKPIGRLVIDLQAIQAGRTNVVLKGGDQLHVPAQMQEVSVLGEVFQPTSHIHASGLNYRDYVNLSGGYTQRADKDRVYIVRANGAVVPASPGWFKKADIQPGDTIIAPLDADRIRPLLLWTNISQILYQLGIAVASWKTVGIL